MIWNEIRKIWNLRSFFLVMVVGITLMYSWVVGQLNLNNLPLFETVQLEIGAQLQKNFGDSLDERELEEVRGLYEEAKEKLDEKVFTIWPELRQKGYETYEEFEQEVTTVYEGEETQKKDWELYEEIVERCGWELETRDTYVSILATAGNPISVLPYQVTMNMSYVMGDYFWILSILVLLLVLPYLTVDNRSGVYQVVAVTRIGRKWIVRQIVAMLVSVLALLFVCSLGFYIVYRIMTPYEPFQHCLVPGLWFDWTWQQYFWIQVIMINLGALALAMVFFFLSSRCRTIVGTVVVAIPCWGAGAVLSMNFYNQLFTISCDGTFYSNTIGRLKSLPFVAEAVLLGIGLLLLVLLYRRRLKEDIQEA